MTTPTTLISTSILQNPLLNLETLKRGGLLPSERLTYTPSLSMVWGLLLGGYQSGQLRARQYLAEHQHNPPKNVEAWYLYHKRKNYQVMLSAIKGGCGLGIKLAGITGAYELIRLGGDIYLGDKKNFWGSSVLAGFFTSTGFSLWYQLPKQSFRYALLLGTGFGALEGGLQQFLDWRKTNDKEDSNETSDS